MNAGEYLKILDSASGISGNENDIAATVTELFGKFCDSVETDNIGNVIGKKLSKKENAPTVMVEAHMDELGLMVSKITDEGSLKFITIGGFDPKVLPGTEVTVHGREKLFGVIGANPPHLITDKNEAVKITDMAVDIGFSKEQTEKKVSVGDMITINTGFTQLAGTFAAGRCIDDRGGLAIIMRMLELLSECELSVNLVCVATVQEEVGLRGARVAAQHIKPDCAIAIDVCHGTSPGVSDDAFPCGKGPVVTLGPNIHPRISRRLTKLAKENEIDIQLEVCDGDTGTDAWAIQTAGEGVPVGLISMPLRYMHGNYEVVDTADIESAAKLICSFVKNYEGGEFLCW